MRLLSTEIKSYYLFSVELFLVIIKPKVATHILLIIVYIRKTSVYTQHRLDNLEGISIVKHKESLISYYNRFIYCCLVVSLSKFDSNLRYYNNYSPSAI